MGGECDVERERGDGVGCAGALREERGFEVDGPEVGGEVGGEW